MSSWLYAVSAGEGLGLVLGDALALGEDEGLDDGFVLPAGAAGVGVGAAPSLADVEPGALTHHEVFVTFVVNDLYAACAEA